MHDGDGSWALRVAAGEAEEHFGCVGAGDTHPGNARVRATLPLLMSFDLGVWHSPRPLEAAEAADVYLALAEGTDPRTIAAVSASPAVSRFLAALAERYPDLDDLPDDRVDDSPWSSGFEKSDCHVLLSVRWSAPDAVIRLISDLASEHELVLYDPQGEQVQIPPALRRRPPKWRFWRR